VAPSSRRGTRATVRRRFSTIGLLRPIDPHFHGFLTLHPGNNKKCIHNYKKLLAKKKDSEYSFITFCNKKSPAEVHALKETTFAFRA
jgi:hypothetical protein